MVKIKLSSSEFNQRNKLQKMNNGNVFSLSTGCEPHTTGTKYRKFANFKNLNRNPKRTSLTNPCVKNKYDSFNKNHLKSINISNNGHGSNNHANSFSKNNNNNSYARKFTMKSVLVRDKTTKLKMSSSKMHNVKVYLIKERPFKSPNLPSREGFCLIKESKQPKYYATPSSLYNRNKLDRKFSSFCDKNSSNFAYFKNKINKSNSWKKIPRDMDNNSLKINKSVSDNTDSCTFVKIKSRFSSDKVCNKLTTNPCKGSPRDKKIVRVINKSSCSSSWKPDIQFHNLNSNIIQSKNSSMNIKHIYKKFKIGTPSSSENIDKRGRDLVNKKHHEVKSNSLNTFKTKKPENYTIRSGNKDLNVQNLKPGDAAELNCHVKENSVSLATGNESFTDTNINKKRKLCSAEKQMEKPRKKIASEISNLYPVVFSMSTRSKRKPDCEEKNDSLKDKHLKSPSTNSKNNCYSKSKEKTYCLKDKSLEKIDSNSNCLKDESLEKIDSNSNKNCSIKSKEKNDNVKVKQLEKVNTNNQINCHSQPKEIFVKHSDNDNNNISLTSEENETLTSKSGNCNLTSFVNDHIQKSKFKNYKGKPPSKVEFDMNNSVVIVHRNPLLEKFVSENLSSTESNSSYLFPISVSEFKSNLHNSKRKDYTLENKIMENGSISNEDVVTIKEEPVNFDDYEVYGMDNSNSNLQQWVIDAFGRVIVKEEVADLEFSERFFFEDSEESPDCNFEGFHDDDMQICIKKEPIDPSSPTRKAELNFPKRNNTLNSSNLSNSNSVETSVRNESDTTDTEDAVETSASSEIETIETEDIVEKSIRSEIDSTETDDAVETSIRSEIDETDIESTNNIKIAQIIRPKRSLKSFKENLATPMKLRTRNSSKKSEKSTCDGDNLSTSSEKSNTEKLDTSAFKSNNKSTVSHLQNHIQIKNTLLTSKSRRSQSRFKSLQLDNSSKTYDHSDASLKSPCKTKRSPRSKIQPKLLPTVRNKSQLSKNDLSFTSNRSTSNTDDVREKVSPDEEQRQRNNAYSKISEKTKGEETCTDKTLFKCSFCSFASYFKASYTLHSKIHHKTEENKDLFLMCKKRKNVYTCTVCKKSFNSSGNMFRHMKLHRSASLYQCMVCKVTLNSSETLKNHIADVHMDSLKFVKPEKLVCKLCPEKFKNAFLFNEHCKIHNQLTCILCNLVCDDELALSTHLKLHEQKSSQYLQCSKCNFVASEKRSFIKHIRNHNDHEISSVEVKQEPKEKIETKKVTCMFCDKEFSGNLDLANHLSAIHSNISSTYKPESNNKETRINSNTENISKKECKDSKAKESKYLTTKELEGNCLKNDGIKERLQNSPNKRTEKADIKNIDKKTFRNNFNSSKTSSTSSSSYEETKSSLDQVISKSDLGEYLSHSSPESEDFKTLHERLQKNSKTRVDIITSHTSEKDSDNSLRLQLSPSKYLNTKLKFYTRSYNQLKREDIKNRKNILRKFSKNFVASNNSPNRVLTRRGKAMLNEENPSKVDDDISKNQQENENLLHVDKKINKIPSSNPEVVDERSGIPPSNPDKGEENFKLIEAKISDENLAEFDSNLFDETIDSLLNENINSIIESLSTEQDIMSPAKQDILPHTEQDILISDLKSISSSETENFLFLNEEIIDNLQSKEEMNEASLDAKDFCESNRKTSNKKILNLPSDYMIQKESNFGELRIYEKNSYEDLKNPESNFFENSTTTKIGEENQMENANANDFEGLTSVETNTLEKETSIENSEAKDFDSSVSAGNDSVKNVETNQIEHLEAKNLNGLISSGKLNLENREANSVENSKVCEGLTTVDKTQGKSEADSIEKDSETYLKGIKSLTSVGKCVQKSEQENCIETSEAKDFEHSTLVENESLESGETNQIEYSNGKEIEDATFIGNDSLENGGTNQIENSEVKDFEGSTSVENKSLENEETDHINYSTANDFEDSTFIGNDSLENEETNQIENSKVKHFEDSTFIGNDFLENGEAIRMKNSKLKDSEGSTFIRKNSLENGETKQVANSKADDTEGSTSVGNDSLESDETSQKENSEANPIEKCKTEVCDDKITGNLETCPIEVHMNDLPNNIKNNEDKKETPITNSPPKVLNSLNYKCSSCEFRTDKLFKLNEHHEIHKGATSQAFECSFCPKMFSDCVELKIHIKTHDDDDDDDDDIE